MAYASASDLMARYDKNDVLALASDTGVAIEESEAAANDVITAALDDASGDIEAALVHAARYSVADLEGLTGNSLAKLKRLVCARAMYYLLERRPAWSPERTEQFDKMTRDGLERLRKGENVFNLDEHKEAGLPSVDGPTTLDFDQLNLLRDRTQNYFPRRNLPNNR